MNNIKDVINEISKYGDNNDFNICLNLENFKTNLCMIKYNHNPIKCVFFHNLEDKRRSFNLINYDLIKCKFNCKKDNCLFSHNKIETLYHPNFYKKKICKNFFKFKKCKFEIFCSFAHSEKELKINLLHKLKINSIFYLNYYKTEFCPWGNILHNKPLCVYAHNFQDFKRNNLYLLEPKQCDNWNITACYRSYEEGCNNGLACKKCHGHLEINYHPKFYKQKLCSYNKNECPLKLICCKKHKDERMYLINKNEFMTIINKKLY